MRAENPQPPAYTLLEKQNGEEASRGGAMSTYLTIKLLFGDQGVGMKSKIIIVLLFAGYGLTAGNPAGLPCARNCSSSLKQGLNGSKGNPAGFACAKNSSSSLRKDCQDPSYKQKPSCKSENSKPATKTAPEREYEADDSAYDDFIESWGIDQETKAPAKATPSVNISQRKAGFQKKTEIIKADAKKGGGAKAETVKEYLATLCESEKKVMDSLVGKYLGRGYSASGAASTAMLEFHGLLRAHLNSIE
jgi:hypothetical protein